MFYVKRKRRSAEEPLLTHNTVRTHNGDLTNLGHNLARDPTWLQATARLYAVAPACSSVLNIGSQFINACSAWLMQLASWQHDKTCESDYEGHNAAKTHRGRGELPRRAGARSLGVNAWDVM